MRAVPPEQVQAMYALYQQGKTLEQVGEQFFYSAPAVGRIFRRHQLPTRTPGEAHMLLKLPQTIRMYRDYQAGMSLREVGEKYGLTLYAIWHRFRKQGLPMRPAKGRSDRVAL